MATKQNTARKRSTNPKAKPSKTEPKLEVVKDASSSEQNPRRRRKRRRNWGGRRKNMSTAGKIAIGVGITLVAVPLVILAVGAVVVGKIATQTIDDIPRTTPIPQPIPTPVYYGVGIPAQTVVHAGMH